MVINLFIWGHRCIKRASFIGGNPLYYIISDGVWVNINSQTATITDACLKCFIYFITFLIASIVTKDTDHLLLVSGVLDLFVVNVPSMLIGKPQPQSGKQSRICFIIPPFLRNVGWAVHRCVWKRRTVNKRGLFSKIPLKFQACM